MAMPMTPAQHLPADHRNNSVLHVLVHKSYRRHFYRRDRSDGKPLEGKGFYLHADVLFNLHVADSLDIFPRVPFVGFHLTQPPMLL
jgi:hypothetical protein